MLPGIQNPRPIEWIETFELGAHLFKMFDGDATNMLRPSDRRNAQNRRRRGGHRSFGLLMGSIVWIKRYTGPFYVVLDNICTTGSMVSAFGHT